MDKNTTVYVNTTPIHIIDADNKDIYFAGLSKVEIKTRWIMIDNNTRGYCLGSMLLLRFQVLKKYPVIIINIFFLFYRILKMNESYYMNKQVFGGVPIVEQHGGSHMVMTNVMKELKTQFISMDTKFRDNTLLNQPVNYNMTFPERITQVKSATVLSVSLPLTFYNISSCLGNNTIVLIFNTGTMFLIIPDGQYTTTTLSTAITAGLTTLGVNSVLAFSLTTGNNPGYSVFTFSPNGTFTTLHIHFIQDNTDISGNIRAVCSTYNDKVNSTNSCLSTSNKTGISKKVAFSALKQSSASNMYSVNSPSNIENSLGWILGFRQSQSFFPDATRKTPNAITSEGLLDLAGPKYLFLALDEFSNSGHSSSFHSYIPKSLLNRNIIARINLDQTKTFGQTQHATPFNGLLYSDNRTYTGDNVDLQKCNIQLVNEYGTPMNLNNMDLSWVLQLKHY